MYWRLLFIPLVLISTVSLRAQEEAAKSQVWFAWNERASANYEPNVPVIRRMVDDLVTAATGARDATEAWKSLVKPADRVGVKMAATGEWRRPLHQAVVDAVVAGLLGAGVPRANIVVWSVAQSKADYDRKAVFTSPLMGTLIWGDLLFSGKRDDLSTASHWHRLLAGGLTKIINVPVLASHEACGVAGAIYNVTIPDIDNWRRFTGDPRGADPYLCEMFADERVRPKVALNIMDGLSAQFAGGPGFDPNHEFAHQTIYVSKDPVALDATAFRQIEKWRVEAKLPPLGSHAEYLQTASAMGLGKYDEAQVELRELK